MSWKWTRRVGLSLGVTLLAGLSACVPSTSMVGAGSSEGRIVPRRPGAMHPNWEYFCHFVNLDNIDAVLNEAGAQGWEMITLEGSVVCFKRPLPPPGYPPPPVPAPAPAPAPAPPPAPAAPSPAPAG